MSFAVWPIRHECYFVMLLYYQLFWTYMADLPIFFRLTSLALGQSFDCPSASEVSLKDMGKIAVCLTRRKHNLINSLKFYTYFTINLYLLLKMFCDSYLYIMLSCFSWLYPKGSRREITTTHCLDTQSLPTKVKFVNIRLVMLIVLQMFFEEFLYVVDVRAVCYR